MNQVLKENTIGIWKLDGNQLYGNDCFLDLIGVPKEMDAQACLKFHLEHVHPEDQEQFGEYVRKLSEERTEIVYRFLHPEKGVMMIRCSGKKMEDGTIAGSATNLMDCVRVVVQKMRIPLESAVKCAAVNSAKSVGIYDQYGSITPGKKANLVLLKEEDLSTVQVILRGQKL